MTSRELAELERIAKDCRLYALIHIDSSDCGSDKEAERCKTEINKFMDTAIALLRSQGEAVYVIFDGPPSHESGRFVEVETTDRKGVGGLEWERCPFPHQEYWRLGPLYLAAPVAPEWVAVGERLPKDDISVLVFRGGTRIERTCRYAGGWLTSAIDPPVTHWMPLPAPPAPQGGRG